MSRFKLSIAYDGRPFEGWQSQPNGNTIQDHLIRAAREICPAVGSIHGSGRTDARVHALAQIAHLEAPVDWSMDAQSWLRALNTKLPRTIRVMNCESTAPDFHAQFSARGKTYRYDLFTGDVLPPLSHGLAWQVRSDIDRGLLCAAAEIFHGEHDFAAFSANRGDPSSNPDNTIRTIDDVTVNEGEDTISLTFSGSGFLYKMVRLLVGGIVRCAEGQISLNQLKTLLENPNSGQKSPLAAPADGLYLVSVRY